MTFGIKRGLALLALTLAATGLLTAAAAAATTAEPRNTTPPTITGTARVGRTLTANNGTWTNSPTTFAYQWQRCNLEGAGCANITGATSKTYVAVAADVDHTLRVGVTASNPDGGNTAFSQPTEVVSANTAPRNTDRPTLSGTAQVGQEMSVSNGTWTGGVRSYTYQWQRCDAAGANCADVTGATGRTYGVRAADEGHTLRAQVTATNLAGSTSVTSDRSSVIRGTTTTTTTPPPPPPPAGNAKPKVTLLSARFVGARLYVRMRVCDDDARVSLFGRESKAGFGFVTHRLAAVSIPGNCVVATRNWRPGAKFQRGRITVTVWARDPDGATSNLARVSFRR